MIRAESAPPLPPTERPTGPATPPDQVKHHPALVDLYDLAGTALRHQNLTGQRLDVTLAISQSEDMRAEWASTRAQTLIARTLAMALHLDQAATLAVAPFGRVRRDPILVGLRDNPKIPVLSLPGVADARVWRPTDMGGCRLDLVVADALGRAKVAPRPRLLIAVIGGDPEYLASTRVLLDLARRYGVFAKIIAVGPAPGLRSWSEVASVHEVPGLASFSAKAYFQTLLVGLARWLEWSEAGGSLV